MVDISQWRARIGLHCCVARYRRVSLSYLPQNLDDNTQDLAIPRVTISLRENVSEGGETTLTSEIKTVIIEHSILELPAPVDPKQDDTSSLLSVVIFYILKILLFMSGDVETNPGPDHEDMVKACQEVIKSHYAILEEAMGLSLPAITRCLYSKQIISEPVKDDPKFDNVIKEFKSMMKLSKNCADLWKLCEVFCECLLSQGGPCKVLAETLQSEFQEIKDNYNSQIERDTSLAVSQLEIKEETILTDPSSNIVTLAKESEDVINQSVDQLHDQFVALLISLKEDPTFIQVPVEEITTWLRTNFKKDFLPLEDLNGCPNSIKLIDKLDKYYDFLDCKFLLKIVQKFVPLLCDRFEKHSQATKTFRSSKSVRELRERLTQIFSPYLRDELSGAPKAQIDLNEVWDKVTINQLYVLIKCFFPDFEHLASSRHIVITCSSVHVTYFMTESHAEICHIKKCLQRMLPLMKFIGVFGLSIDGESILQRNDDPKFAFKLALHDAAKAGRIEAVELLLQLRICNPDTKVTTRRNTALMIASLNGHYIVVELLLNEGGANPNIQNKKGVTALMIASEHGWSKVVELLLYYQADPNIQSRSGLTALLLASQNGHKHVVDLLLGSGANANYQHPGSGTTALMISTQNGYPRLVESLLLYQADTNIQNDNGETAILMVSEKKNYFILELLLQRGADPNISDRKGLGVLRKATENGDQNMVEILLKYQQTDPNIQDENGVTSLMVACENGHEGIVNLLLQHNADTNVQSQNGWFGLLFACKKGHLELVRLLLNEGSANPNLQTRHGTTALMLASQFKSHQNLLIVEILLQKHADPNMLSHEQVSALMIASQNGNDSAVELLLQNKADPNMQNQNGYTALMLASQKGNRRVCSLLIDAGVNPDIQDGNGLTALMLASENGFLHTVQSLLVAKANVDTQNKDGVTALLIASQNGHIKVVKELLKEKADPSIASSTGVTPLKAAKQNKHDKIAEVLQTECLSGFEAEEQVHIPSDEPKNPSELPENPSELSEDPSELPEDPSELPEYPSELTEDPSELPEDPSELPEDPSELPEDPSELPEDLSELPEKEEPGFTLSGTEEEFMFSGVFNDKNIVQSTSDNNRTTTDNRYKFQKATVTQLLKKESKKGIIKKAKQKGNKLIERISKNKRNKRKESSKKK